MWLIQSTKYFVLLLLQSLLNSSAQVTNSAGALFFDNGKIYNYQFTVSTELVLPSFTNGSTTDQIDGLFKLRVGKSGHLEVALKEVRSSIPEQMLCERLLSSTYLTACNLVTQPLWMKNLKRSILSHFQITANSLEVPSYTTETDISGECLTEYNPQRLSSTLIKVVKHKYTAGCNKRYKFRTQLQWYPTQPPKRSQKIPDIDGDLHCTSLLQTDLGVFNSTCVEKVIVVQNWDATAETNLHVETKLQLLGTENNNRLEDTQDFSSITDLPFDFRGYDNSLNYKVTDGQSKFVQMVQDLHQKNKPRLLYEAIELSKVLDNEDHRAIFDEMQKEDYAEIRNVYTNILVETGTAAAFQVVESNAKSLGLSIVDILRTLRNVDNPRPELFPLLKQMIKKYPTTSVILPISETVQRLYQKEPSLQDNEDVKNLLGEYLTIIGTNCSYGDSEKMKEVILALRSLGNVGGLIQKPLLSNMLAKCLSNTELDVIVHVSAIEAVRLAECDSNLDTILWTRLSDPLVDIELRIVAYRSYMRCPMESKLREIVQLLDNEPSQQFGSYVFSHLTNLVNLVGPISEPWAKYIGPFEKFLVPYQKRFRLNRRSYSKQYGSYYRTKNGGIHIETSVIFGPESPLPRAVTINLTLESLDNRNNFLEFGIRCTEQFRIWKNLVNPSMSVTEGQLDSLETALRNKRRILQMTTAFIRTNGQEWWYTEDFMKALKNVFISSADEEQNKVDVITTNHVLFDSSVFIPTIGGFPLEVKLLAMAISQSGSANQLLVSTRQAQMNWTMSASVLIGTQLKIESYKHHSLINQWYQSAFNANVHGLFKYTSRTNYSEVQIYLNDWTNDQLFINFRRNNFAELDGETVSSTPNKPHMVIISQTQPYIDTLLGLSATSKVIFSDNSSDLLPVQLDLSVNHFRGLDAQFILEQGATGWLGSVSRCVLLFSRPGELSLLETRKQHLKINYEVGQINDSAQFVQLQFLPPWEDGVELHFEFNQDGIFSATGNINSVPWELYGVHTEADSQQKVTAKLTYPAGSATIVFRGNLTENFKLRVHSADESWPVPLEMTQRMITSRHQNYPSFKRFHHDIRLRLRDNQNLNLQLEWNTGRRNGRLEQGILRLKHTGDYGRSEMQSAVTWTEGYQASRLDKTVPGYARQLIVETNVTQPEGNSIIFSVGMDQFLSKNFWMIHTDRPAIVSLHLWTHSPNLPSVQLNYSTACTLRYRLDKGGSIEAFSNLLIPQEKIDALAKVDLQWKSNRKAGVPWIQDATGSLTLRIFPPEYDRYFRVNVSHAINQNVITAASIEFDSSTVYLLESTLYRKSPVHRVRLRWPPGQEVVMNTTYQLQVGPQTAIEFKHVLAKDEDKLLGAINTEILYNMDTRRLLIRHNSTKYVEDAEPQLIIGFEWGNELHGQVKKTPFQVNFKAEGLLQIQIPILEIDSRIEALLGNRFSPNGAEVQARLLYSKPIAKNKYGMDVSGVLTTDPNTILQANLDFYLSGKPVRSSGCELKYTTSNSSRLVAIECDKENFGSFIFHEKFRRKDELDLEGSHMLAIIPTHPTERFNGWYSNYNYAFARFPLGFSIEIRGEFTSNSGIGPGTPIRLYIQSTHDKFYRTGTIETVFNSQHMGYWTGYEMVTTMSRYELNGLDTPDQQRTLTIRSIFGVRLLEGRGTRGFEGGLQLALSPLADQLLIQAKLGKPGMTRENTLRFQYELEPFNPSVSLDLTLFDRKEFSAQFLINYDEQHYFNGATFEFIIDRLNIAQTMKLIKQNGEINLIATSQGRKILEGPLTLTEDVLSENKANPLVVIGQLAVSPSNNLRQIPVKIMHQLSKGDQEKSLKSMNLYLRIGHEHDNSNRFVNLTIKSGVHTDELNELSLQMNFPWPLEASVSFGKPKSDIRYYQHLIKRLPLPEHSGWISKADCYLTGAYQIGCGVSYSTPERVVNVSLTTKPESGFYQTELAWDRTRNGLIQTIVIRQKENQSLQINSPLRDILFHIEKKENKDRNKSTHLITNYTVQTISPDTTSGNREARAVLLVYQHTVKENDRQNWTYGSKLQSNLLLEDTVEGNITVASEQEQLSFNAKVSTGNELIQQLSLLLKADETENDAVQSKFGLTTAENDYSITGRHVLRQSYISSELMLSHPIYWMSSGCWNVTIDSWNKLRITNDNKTSIVNFMWQNNTHGTMQQTLLINNGQLNMTHQSSLKKKPFQLNTNLASRKGHAWITGYMAGTKECLIEAEHSASMLNMSTLDRRKDVIARFFIDPENTVHANLNWRPGLINELLLYGTELSDVELLKNPVPIAASAHRLLTLVTDPNSTSLINHQVWQNWYQRVIEDLQHIPDTLRQWWKDDRFYMRSFNLPVLEQLGAFNITDLAHNVSLLQNSIVEEFANILHNASKEDLIPSEQLESFKRSIERKRFPLFRPTFEAMVRMANRTIWTTGQFANFLFHKVAASTNAVYILQQSLQNWASSQYTWLINLNQMPFVTRLEEFLTRLQSDIPALKQINCFANKIAENLSAMARHTVQYCKRLAAELITGKEFKELIILMTTGNFENASRLFFKPELSTFTADLDNGHIQFSAHIPVLFERITDTLTNPQSYLRQLLSWSKPNRGMRSVMYAYDQYQRNFEAMRKWIHLIPPYKVTAWLMMDSANNGYIITFNGLFIPVVQPHSGPYLLLANKDAGRKLRILHEFASAQNGYQSEITVGSVTVRVTQHGQIQELDGDTIKPMCLPYTRTVDNTTSIRVIRTGDRITLRLLAIDRSVDLMTVMLNIRLRHMRVQLDGVWHGQCRGLLGTNDFDQLHELLEPGQNVLSNQSMLAKLWSYANLPNNSQDQVEPAAQVSEQNQTRLNSDSYQLCRSMWRKFQLCFNDVIPDPWIEACVFAYDQTKSDQLKQADSKNERIEQSCMVARAYVQTCNWQDVPVRVPLQCVSIVSDCKMNELSVLPEDKVDVTGRRITFVIEMGNCFTIRMTEITELLTLLNKSKQSSQLQYSALLFTTISGVTETTRLTANNGSIWMSGEQFLQTLNTFAVQHNAVDELPSVGFSEWPRALEALSKAIRQPASPDGFHDSVLLFICSGCTPEGSQYKTLTRVTKRKGIEFHYLPEASFSTVGDLNNNVFLLTSDDHYDELKPDGSTRRVVNIGTVNAPRDHCSLIAKGSGGYIWAYQNVVTSKRRMRAVVASIASHLNRKVTLQRHCVCRDDLYGAGVLDCSVDVDTPLKGIKDWKLPQKPKHSV